MVIMHGGGGVKKCSMMPEWHKLVPKLERVEKSETAQNCDYMRLQSSGSFFCLSTRLKMRLTKLMMMNDDEFSCAGRYLYRLRPY